MRSTTYEMAELAPTWLFYASSRSTAGNSRSRRPVEFRDRPGPPSLLNSEDLRRFNAPSLHPADELPGAVAGVIARPWGRDRALRNNPDHPENRSDLQHMAAHWNRLQPGQSRSGLWFAPAWVLDTWVRPQFVSLSSFESLVVHFSNGQTGPVFAPGLTTHTHRPLGGAEILPYERRVFVMDIAGPSHAPGFLRPGTVLDTRVYTRPTFGARVALDLQSTSSSRSLFMGTVVEKVPARAGRVLPGEPLEDIRDRWIADMRVSVSWIEDANEVAQQSAGAPRLVGK